MPPRGPSYASQVRTHWPWIAVLGENTTVRRPSIRATSVPTSVLPAPGGIVTHQRVDPARRAASKASSASCWCLRSGCGQTIASYDGTAASTLVLSGSS